MKHIFRSISSVFLIVLLGITACQKTDDTQAIIEEKQESTLSLKIESGKHLRILNPVIYEKLETASRQSSSFMKTENDTQTVPFSLDLTTIQIIEKTNYTQYTLNVFHPESDTNLVNYMLLVFNDETHYQYLVKYPRITT